MSLRYPDTPRGDVVDHLHGYRIADPYRWLEDPDAPATRAWVDAQNAVTEDYLAQLPARDEFRQTVRASVMQPVWHTPQYHAGWYLQSRFDIDAPQPVVYVAASLEELTAGGGRVLINPNAWSDAGTSSLHHFSVSPDGRLVAYGQSDAGSDWTTVRIKDMATGEDIDAEPVVTKFCFVQWLPDSRSFIYRTFEGQTRADGADTTALPVSHLTIRRLDGATDEVLWANPGDPLMMASAEVDHDERWLAVTIAIGTQRTNRLWLYALTTDADGTQVGSSIRLIDEDTDAVEFVRALDSDEVLLLTDRDAPQGRLVRTPIEAVGGEFTDVVAEQGDPIEWARACGAGVLLARLVDASPRLERWDLAGGCQGEVDVPTGAVVSVSAEADRDEYFVGISTLVAPLRAWRGSFATGEAVELPQAPGAVAGPDIIVERYRATNADGTQVPYFLAYANSDAGARPTILYGYGGFSVPLAASYGVGWPAWIAAGGAVAIANLRGGGEFGRAWYDDGRLAHKQHVFDDAIAVAEDLLATERASRVAIHGRSNGGLLVGATMTQRPDLFAAAIPAVGVLDLLRFHRFTGGKLWVSDYGDPDIAGDFEVALAYSPLHNVREGTAYPPTLVLTGDHDDRVVPLHSHKFTAAVQHAQAGDAPILTRIEKAAGHGMGKPRTLLADEWGDLLAFAAHHTGLGDHP